MHVEQIYTGCLAQGAYYIESDGEAAVIDPLRETQPYTQRAEDRGARIKYIFETHFHADFVSGHLDLARKTGAQIIYGPKAETAYEKYQAKDGQEFKLGRVTIRVLHTPGHTPESTCFLLLDEEGKEHAIFTGDTLFIGDVGRPDLAQKSTGLTKEDLAGWLYDSLREKIMPLPDDVIVYPAHGAGSACGKNMSTETWSTLGVQKRTNYALRADMTREEFIKEVTEGLAPPPQYFAKNAALNKMGYESIDKVIKRGMVPLTPDRFEAVANAEGALVLDVRDKEDFAHGFIPNAIFIGLDGSFAPWVGALIPDLQQPILLVAPVDKVAEAQTRLARVGYDNVVGYLEGGFASWIKAGKEVDTLETVDIETLEKRFHKDAPAAVLDVRKPSEFAAEHIENAQNLPLDYINQNMDKVDREKSYFVHCKSGYRATIASSILKSRGFHDLVSIYGQFDDIIASASIPTTDYVCPTTVENS